ncbi:hypothetical protein PtB15_18B360 [Puccinia triticina]|nr:hypothetical protein PtB15_18B360 [Puccinia triticina]
MARWLPKRSSPRPTPNTDGNLIKESGRSSNSSTTTWSMPQKNSPLVVTQGTEVIVQGAVSKFFYSLEDGKAK